MNCSKKTWSLIQVLFPDHPCMGPVFGRLQYDLALSKVKDMLPLGKQSKWRVGTFLGSLRLQDTTALFPHRYACFASQLETTERLHIYRPTQYVLWCRSLPIAKPVQAALLLQPFWGQIWLPPDFFRLFPWVIPISSQQSCRIHSKSWVNRIFWG